MGREKNLHELSVIVISLLTIWVKHEFREWQFTLHIVILGKKLINFIVISHEIAKIMWDRHEWEFMTWDWSETWFHEMLKIPFEREFSVNTNSLKRTQWFFLLYKLPSFSSFGWLLEHESFCCSMIRTMSFHGLNWERVISNSNFFTWTQFDILFLRQRWNFNWDVIKKEGSGLFVGLSKFWEIWFHTKYK